MRFKYYNQLTLKMEMESNEFLKIAHLAARMNDYQQVVQDQEAKLELLSFQIAKMHPEQAKKTYHRIQKKYEPPNGLSLHPESWLESQKRLFAWFIVFYTYINRDQTGNFPVIDFQYLAPFLFHKSPDFLLFHFLIMLKTSQKIVWDQQKDRLLLEAMNEQGMRWNEVSRTVFMKTGKEVFLPPKACRERWLNHLDNTKCKGNWETQEDFVILKHVVETQSKKWSKMVELLKNKRSEHSIKNRFNTLIAKHRKYKSEKDLKVAARILECFQLESDVQSSLQGLNHAYKSNSQQEAGQNGCQQKKKQLLKQDDKLEIKEMCQNRSKPIELPSSIKSNFVQYNHEVIVKQEQKQEEPLIPEQPKVIQRQTVSEGYYPFQNYSYEQDLCNFAPQIFDFQQQNLFFYQPIFTLAIPTADTLTREARLLEQRKKRRNGQGSRQT